MILCSFILLLSSIIIGILPFLKYVNRRRLDRLEQITRSMNCRIRALKRYDYLIDLYHKKGYEMTVNYCLTRMGKLLRDLVVLEDEWNRIRLNCDLYQIEVWEGKE